MNKISLRLRATLAVCFGLLSCLSFSTSAQLLYKVGKPGSDKVSYLLGTHHFAPVEILDSITGLNEAFNSVERVYGEVDMAEMNNPASMMKYMDKLAAPADSTLDKLLTAAELDTVAGVWDRLSKGAAPLNMLYGMKPSVISTQMMSLVLMERFPDKDFTAPGIDLLMQNRAKEAGKEVLGLESIPFQINMLYCTPLTKQKNDLMKSVRDGGKSACEEMMRLTDAYMARDINTLEEMMTDPDEMTPEEANRLLYSRNANWAEQLAPVMNDHSVMVVVGAGHLPAKGGLIDLLRQAGYTVTAVD